MNSPRTTTNTILPVGGTASLSLLLLLLLVSNNNCQAHPSMILNGGETKCVLFEAAMDTTIKIDYKAPDLVLDKNDPNFSPAYLTVNVFPSNRVIDTKHHEAPVKSHLKATKVLLEDKEGRNIKHKFELDGDANICFRAPKSRKGLKYNSLEYYRFEYHVRLLDGLDGDDDDEGKKGKGKPTANQTDIFSHLTHMEKEIQRIQRGMQTILREADFAKDRDALFYKQTESMHSATMFWPIVQVCILLMTGFTQANHIVQFFKQRRII